MPDQPPADPLAAERIAAVRELIRQAFSGIGDAPLTVGDYRLVLQTLDALAAFHAGGLETDEEIGRECKLVRESLSMTIDELTRITAFTLPHAMAAFEEGKVASWLDPLRRIARALNHRLVVHLAPIAKGGEEGK